MKPAKFYHVYITPKIGITADQVQERMDLSLDWFRFDYHNWIVYSTNDAASLVARFRPLIEPDGRIFISEISTTNRNGWMPPYLWDWLQKAR